MVQKTSIQKLQDTVPVTKFLCPVQSFKKAAFKNHKILSLYPNSCAQSNLLKNQHSKITRYCPCIQILVPSLIF